MTAENETPRPPDNGTWLDYCIADPNDPLGAPTREGQGLCGEHNARSELSALRARVAEIKSIHHPGEDAALAEEWEARGAALDEIKIVIPGHFNVRDGYDVIPGRIRAFIADLARVVTDRDQWKARAEKAEAALVEIERDGYKGPPIYQEK